jgi:hypothetical protein
MTNKILSVTKPDESTPKQNGIKRIIPSVSKKNRELYQHFIARAAETSRAGNDKQL